MKIKISLFFITKFIKIYGHPITVFSFDKTNIEVRFKQLLRFYFLKNSFKSKKDNYIKKIFFFFFSSFFLFNFQLRKIKYIINMYSIRNFICKRFIQNCNFLKMNFKKLQFLSFKNEKKFKIRKFLVIKEKNYITACSFMLSQSNISFGLSCGTICIFDIYNKRYKYYLKNSNHSNNFLYSHPHLNTIILSSGKNSSKIWNLSMNLKKLQILSLYHESIIISICFRSSGKFIDFATYSKTLKTFDIENQKWIVRNTFNNQIFCISSDRNGKVLALGKKNELTIFDFRINKEVIKIVSDESITNISWLKQDYNILGSDALGLISLWDLRNAKKKEIIGNFPKAVNFIKPFQNNNFLITSGYLKKVVLLNLQHHEKFLYFTGHKKKIISMDFADQTNMLFTAGLDYKLIFHQV